MGRLRRCSSLDIRAVMFAPAAPVGVIGGTNCRAFAFRNSYHLSAISGFLYRW